MDKQMKKKVEERIEAPKDPFEEFSIVELEDRLELIDRCNCNCSCP